MSNPAISAEPFVGCNNVVSIFIVVVLPAPLGPRKPKISPFFTENVILSTAVRSSNFFVKLFVLIMSNEFCPLFFAYNINFVNKFKKFSIFNLS